MPSPLLRHLNAGIGAPTFSIITEGRHSGDGAQNNPSHLLGATQRAGNRLLQYIKALANYVIRLVRLPLRAYKGARAKTRIPGARMCSWGPLIGSESAQRPKRRRRQPRPEPLRLSAHASQGRDKTPSRCVSTTLTKENRNTTSSTVMWILERPPTLHQTIRRTGLSTATGTAWIRRPGPCNPSRTCSPCRRHSYQETWSGA